MTFGTLRAGILATLAFVLASCASATESQKKPGGDTADTTVRFPLPSMVNTVTLPIGSDSVMLRIYTNRFEDVVFVALHDDENTAVEVSNQAIHEGGGRFVEVVAQGTRTIRFRVAGRSYRIDPNRIFTDRGIASTLSFYGATSEEARSAVRAFAAVLLDTIARGAKAIVAMHNNGPGGYSVRSYMAGGEYERDAEGVFAAPGFDDDDFVFTSHAPYYEYLRSAGVSCVLQDNRRATDDGSLSVYCAAKGIAYANIEAEEGHYREQLLMLRVLRQVLPNGDVQ